MATEAKLLQLRTLLQQAELNPKERRVAEELLEKAARGDEVALRQIEQAARERGGLSFTPVPGEDPALPPGPLFVCPIDPEHYRAYQREVGVDLTCPEHGVPLRQADTEV
jgi:hypothetical protein